MNIIIITKRNLFIFIISLIIFLTIYCQYSISKQNTLKVSSDEDNDLQNTLSNLTNQKEKIAYLTFDDGPTLKSTPKILDILSQENIKATFFVVGKHVKEHPELVKRAYDEGHYIANHGYTHNNNKLYSNSTTFISEIQSTDVEIGKAIGIANYCSHVFRFPNGYMSSIYKSQKENYAKLLSDIDYAYIDWNCLNRDSEKKFTNSELLNNLKNSCKNKGTLVILMHDTSDVNQTDLVLKDSINYLKEQGYVFKNFYDIVKNNKR